VLTFGVRRTFGAEAPSVGRGDLYLVAPYAT